MKSYRDHLINFVELFEGKHAVHLSACAYLHNYAKHSNDALFSSSFTEVLKDGPIFTKTEFEALGKYLKERLAKGKGMDLFNKFAQSRIQPSKKLLEYTKQMVNGQHAFHLIDEQLAANNTIIACAKKAAKLKKKTVILVRGGPGTGKSVIALNALAELISRNITVFHATGSSAFTNTLRKIVGTSKILGTSASTFFKFFNSFMTYRENQIDVLIADEAHRIRKTSSSRYSGTSTTPQIDELMRVAKVCIFFIDDYQVVRSSEIGSSELIRTAAKKYGADLFEYELTTQFRCNGSDGYLNWVDNTLGVRDTANRILTKTEKLEFKIFDSPEKLYAAIKKKNDEGLKARIAAGYCWPWSYPNPDGTLKNDVVIGKFEMPWEAKPGAKKLAPGIPTAALWAYDPGGIGQVGTVYTSQGFEFDYIGVIFGKDLIYDSAKKEWVGHPENSSDTELKRGEEFVKHVKNVYRVLLTRGMKGCYIYFMDKETEKLFRSRLDGQ